MANTDLHLNPIQPVSATEVTDRSAQNRTPPWAADYPSVKRTYALLPVKTDLQICLILAHGERGGRMEIKNKKIRLNYGVLCTTAEFPCLQGSSERGYVPGSMRGRCFGEKMIGVRWTHVSMKQAISTPFLGKTWGTELGPASIVTCSVALMPSGPYELR